jgi:hypothetical protein
VRGGWWWPPWSSTHIDAHALRQASSAAPPPLFLYAASLIGTEGGRRSTVRDLVGVVGSGAGEVVQVVAGAGVAGRDSAAAGTRDGEAAGRAPSPCEFGDLGFTGAAVETLLRGK